MRNAMIRTAFLALMAASLLVVPRETKASDITYNLNLTIGSGSVIGDIVTDGTIGNLSATSHIVDWNLLVNDGSTSFDLTGPLSGGNSILFDHTSTGDLSATATQMSFNFGDSSATNYLYFVNTNPAFPQYELCLEASTADCVSGVPAGAEVIAYFTSTGVGDIVQYASQSGTQVIGTVAPEPSSLLMLGSGLLGLVALAFCRKRIV